MSDLATAGPAGPAASASPSAGGAPAEPICPITLAPPRHGVRLPGEPHTLYERDAIAAWLQQCPTSPLTRRRYYRRVALLPRDPGDPAVHVALAASPVARWCAGLQVMAAGACLATIGTAMPAICAAHHSELGASLGLLGVASGAAIACVGWRMIDWPAALAAGLEQGNWAAALAMADDGDE